MPQRMMEVSERRLGFALLLAMLLHLAVIVLVKPFPRQVARKPASAVLEVRVVERSARATPFTAETPQVMEPDASRMLRPNGTLPERKPASSRGSVLAPAPEKRPVIVSQPSEPQAVATDAGMPVERPGGAEPAKTRTLDFSNLQDIIRRSAAEGGQRDEAQRRAHLLKDHASDQLAQSIARAFGHDGHVAIAGIDLLADGTVKVTTPYGTTYCFRENERFALDSPVRPTEIPMTCP